VGCDRHGVADRQLTRLRLFLLFLVAIPRASVGLVTPGVRLRAGHDARDVWIFAFVSLTTSAAPRTCFRTPGSLFLLLFRSSPLSLALASRQWIPCSHLALL
jgi:hypothetical protein